MASYSCSDQLFYRLWIWSVAACCITLYEYCISRSYETVISGARVGLAVDVWVRLHVLTVFSDTFLRHLFFQLAVLQVTALLLDLAGVGHAVFAPHQLHLYTKSVQILTF